MAKQTRFEFAEDEQIATHAPELDLLLKALDADPVFHQGRYSDESWLADVFQWSTTDAQIEAAMLKIGFPGMGRRTPLVAVLSALRVRGD